MSAAPTPVPVRHLDGLAYAVVDVETTSAFPRSARIIEVAVVHCNRDGTRAWAWHTLVNPGCAIDNTDHHGIATEDVADAPTFADVAEDLVCALAGRVLVGHNIVFDHEVLTRELARCGSALPEAPRLCTMRMARDLGLEVHDHRLETLLEALELPSGLAHSALHDTAATGALFASLVALYPQRHIAETTAWTGPLRPTGEPADPSVLAGSTVCRDGLDLASLDHFPPRASAGALARFARTPEQAEAARSAERRCPRCGTGHLVTRTRRRDGSRFHGCSLFPDCRYTENA